MSDNLEKENALRALIERHCVDIVKDSSQQGLGFRTIFASSYILLSNALPVQCSEGSRFFAAKAYGVKKGLSNELASEAAALYFALNPNTGPTSMEPIDPASGDLPLRDVVPDLEGFARGLSDVGLDLSLKEKVCLYILLAYAGESQSEEEEQEVEYVRALVSSMFSTLDKSGSNTRSLSEIPPTDTYYLPTAKAFWYQRKIAASGQRADLRVDSSNSPLVTIAISNTDGRPLDIQPGQELLQIVIYQMIRKAGCPIIVSLDQICREYLTLGGSNTITVSDETREQVEHWMDEMLFNSDVTLDYSRQVESQDLKKKHPKCDYSQSKERAALIVGEKHTDSMTTYRGHTIKTSYTIYAAPMLCRYSEKIAQIASVPIRSIAPAVGKSTTGLSLRASVIRNALVRHIERIRSLNASPPRILLRTLLADCGGESLTPKQARDVREKALRVLDDFKASGYIVGYTLFYERRAVAGFDIEVAAAKKSGQRKHREKS